MGLVKPGQEFTPEHIETIYHRGNDDGFGLAYVEGERYEDGPNQGKLVKPGRVKIEKSMGVSWELKKIFQGALDKKVPFLFHLRNATAGDKNIENCHPYQILDIDKDDPIDLYMFHNGTLRNAWVKKEMSDSWNFATIHLRGLLRERPSMMYEEGFRYFLSTMIEGNKLMFLDNRERVSIINYELGSIQPSGVWLSTKEKVEPAKSYRPAPIHTAAPFQLGAGQDTADGPKKQSTPSPSSVQDTSTGTDSSKIKVTFKMGEGAKWILSSDGRSHYVPRGITPADKDSGGQLALLGSGNELDADVVRGLIDKAAPPKTPDDYNALRRELGKLDQVALHDYVREFPVETGFMIRYLAGIEPDSLPEFTELSTEEIIAWAIRNTWNAMYALISVVRVSKEKVLEVN